MNQELNSKEKLILATKDYMLDKGTLDLSVRSIAAKAGVNHGLVHHYFGSLEGMLTESMQQFAEVKFQEISAKLQLQQQVTNPIASSAQDPEFAKLFLAYYHLGASMPGLRKAQSAIAVKRRSQIGQLLGLDEDDARLFQAVVIGGLILKELDPGYDTGKLMKRLLGRVAPKTNMEKA